MKRSKVKSRAGVIVAKISDIDAVETVLEYAESAPEYSIAPIKKPAP